MYTSTMTPFAILTLLIVALIGTTAAYSTPKSTSQSQRQTSTTVVNRSTFLATAASTCLAFLASSPPAFAKDVDPALKGTKADPEFQACLSQCVYECTKPKGMEQRSRAECLPECKSKCAKTKQQTMTGSPK